MKNLPYSLKLVILSIAIVATFAVPIYQIYKYQDVIDNGETLKFRLKTYYNNRNFSGNFIRVNLETPSYPIDPPMSREEISIKYNALAKNMSYAKPQAIFILLGQDAEGFATIDGISSSPYLYTQLTTSVPFYLYNFKAEPKSKSWDTVTSYQPIFKTNLFYMNEELTFSAREQLTNQKNQDKIYAKVKLKDEIMVIEDIFIGDKSIKSLR